VPEAGTAALPENIGAAGEVESQNATQPKNPSAARFLAGQYKVSRDTILSKRTKRRSDIKCLMPLTQRGIPE